jgi:hypothetical protein
MGATDMSELTLEEIAGADYCFAHGHPINLKTGRKLIALARRSLPSPPQPEQREDEWISACGNFPKHPTTPLPAPGERVKVTGPIIGEDGYLKPKSEWPNPEEAMPGPNYVKKWEQETGTPFLPTPPKAPGEGDEDKPYILPGRNPQRYTATPTPPKDTVGKLCEHKHVRLGVCDECREYVPQTTTPDGLCERLEHAFKFHEGSPAPERDTYWYLYGQAATALRQMQEELEATENVTIRWMHHHKDRERENADLHATIAAKDADLQHAEGLAERYLADSNEAQATIARLREALSDIAENTWENNYGRVDVYEFARAALTAPG